MRGSDRDARRHGVKELNARLRALCFALTSSVAVGVGHAQRTIRVSVPEHGGQGSGASDRPWLSDDGSRLVFTSAAGELAPGDSNGKADVFVRDMRTGAVELVSVNLSGTAGNGTCGWPVISADGRVVAFSSLASDLVPGDTPGSSDTFVRDLAAGTTEMVTVGRDGSPADSASRGSALSADGRFVAFVSKASNLVPGDTGGFEDVFVRDRVTGTTERVSVHSSGAQADGHSGGAWISADGRFVSFASSATNLVDDDTNLVRDVFVHDRATGTTRCVSRPVSGVEGDSQSGFNHLFGYFTTFLSPDARFVVFHSYASNLVPGDTNTVPDIFVVERETGAVERVSVASDGTESDERSYFPVMFGDGRYVAFKSAGTNLVLGDGNGAEDVFLHDRRTGTTSRISLNSLGAEGDLESDYPTASADGSRIVFESLATNLVPGDSNGVKDLFERRLEPACPPPTTYCTARTSSQGCTPGVGAAGQPSLSSNVPFVLTADDLPGGSSGLLLYGHAPAALPVGGGWLCIAAPFARSSPRATGGSGANCSGFLAVDLGTLLTSALLPALLPGANLYAQFWVRDRAQPTAHVLSQGLAFTLCP